MQLVAYVDESMLTDQDPGAYILVGSVMDAACCETLRDRLATELVHTGPAFHWKDANDGERLRTVKTIAALQAEVFHIVVIGRSLRPRHEERARRLCLQRLLFELERLGVEQVWLESRRTKQDNRDLKAVGGFRAQRIISAAIRVDHAVGKTSTGERLLSIPDIVAGAIRAGLAGVGTYAETLAEVVSIFECDVS